MSVAIHKYILDRGYRISIPIGAELLSVQIQNNKLVAWALVDTDVEIMEYKTFRVVTTGLEISSNSLDDYEFFTTVQTHNGLVFHVFKPMQVEHL